MINERGIRSFICAIVAFFIFGLFACSPLHRVRRIIRNHPHIATSIYQDSIVVDSVEIKDTIFVSKSKTDTIKIDGIRIVRVGDTIRVFGTQRPCTTYIKKVIMQPAKSKGEQRREWKQKKYEIKKNAQIEKLTLRGSWLRATTTMAFGLIIGIFIGLIIKPKNHA
jgi:hypothetical protein